ncbi:MAG: signal peptidase I [Candidatus Eisenbacteria bacterium]|uniref:Signal peptidase I n=1 Tax=Eiseniibacteriota bacterium TaxID=2212470 RepID=A0A956LWZ4_UNCEI|nr:signal peptidase I [Candidatus Eisenbacteria bacterium]
MESDALGVLGATAFGGMMILVYLVVMAFSIVCSWMVFAKAGKPGWASLVPIYNLIVMLEIVGKPLWWIALLFVPIANIVVSFLINIELAKSFRQDAAFGIGLTLLPIIFFAILAFGSAEYAGPPTPTQTGFAA